MKEFIVQNSDPTLIDSLKSAFYKWNGKKYRPKTEIYDKYYELLWTRWNILQYNFKKHLTNIDVTSDPTNQKPILQNVVKQSEPDTQGIQHSVPQIINRSGPESNESPNILTRKYLFAYNSNAYPLDSICVLLNVKSLQPKNEDIILAPKPIDDFKSLEEAILLAFVDQNRFTNFARKFRSGNFFLYEFHVNTSGEIIFNLSKKYQEYDFSQKILHT
ncbi:hypothetical protein KJ656_17325, partial [bacterium]|nr:hypothetical protein [bacterium]